MSCHCSGSPRKAGISPMLRTKSLLVFSPFESVHPQSTRPSWQGKGWYNMCTPRGSCVPTFWGKIKQGRNTHSYNVVVVLNNHAVPFSTPTPPQDSLKVQDTVPHAVNKIPATGNTVLPSSGCRALRNVLQSLLPASQTQPTNKAPAHHKISLQCQRNECASTLRLPDQRFFT